MTLEFINGNAGRVFVCERKTGSQYMMLSSTNCKNTEKNTYKVKEKRGGKEN